MSGQTSTNQTEITTPADREIRIERVFEAERERVFDAFTSPELVPQWWGARDDVTTVEEMDVQPGGRWKYVCSGPESDDVFSGVYREVTPPEGLIYTFEWGGMPGHVIVEHVSFDDLGGWTSCSRGARRSARTQTATAGGAPVPGRRRARAAPPPRPPRR